jgi:cytochrome c biogenesis factor
VVAVNDGVGIAVTVLLIGLVLTLIVGQILIRAGQDFLQEVFSDRGTARSVSRLLAVLFHLVVLGILLLISTTEVPPDGAFETVVTKIGLVLLVLGAAHGGTMLVLARIRSRRQEQALAEEMNAQFEVSRQQQGQYRSGQYGQHMDEPSAHTPRDRPVIEAGPQQ